MPTIQNQIDMGKGFYSTDDPESTLEPMLDPEEQKKIDAEAKAASPKL